VIHGKDATLNISNLIKNSVFKKTFISKVQLGFTA